MLTWLRRLWLVLSPRLRCWCGAHSWCYGQDRDHLGRPLARKCQLCDAQQERRYTSYARGGYGPWRGVR